MSSQLEKGQLVAVRDHPAMGWTLRMYDHVSPEGRHFCVCPDNTGTPCWWEHAKPAEEVWPELFCARDRNDVERAEARQSGMLEQISGYHKRIGWLVREIVENFGECPPDKRAGEPCTEEDGDGCIACWIAASGKAAREAGHE